VRYRSGDFEIEVSSPDKAFVDAKLAELLKKPAPAERERTLEERKPTRKPSRSSTKAPAPSSTGRELDVPALVERINEADNHAQLEAHVLNKRDALPRVMLCLHEVRKDSSPYLSTGDIEKITNQLGVRIFSENAARAIRQNLKYFTADSVRGGRGAKPKYKLNRQGIAAFEKLLKGEQL
jgi:hypothetical protein